MIVLFLLLSSIRLTIRISLTRIKADCSNVSSISSRKSPVN